MVMGTLVMLLGAAVLVGWLLDLPRVRSVMPGLAEMKFNTALCFLLAGAALTLERSRSGPSRWWAPAAASSSRLLAGLVGLVGLLTVAEYATGTTLGIDELLVSDRPAARFPGRMSAVTATCFLLFGIGLALPRSPRAGAAFSFACTAGLLVSFLAVLGYLYGVRAIYRPVEGTVMAVHTAIGLVVLFAGSLLSRPNAGWLRICLRPGSVGLILRVLLPLVIVFPVLLGWLALKGVALDLYGPAGLVALLVTATTLMLPAAAVLVARRAERLDEALAEQQALYRRVLGNSPDAFVMMDQDGRVLDWNPQAQQAFGWSREEAVGRLVEELALPENARAAHRAGLARFVETGEGPMALRRTTVTAMRRGGEEFAAELMIVPIESRGNWRFAGFVRDVSEQLATEAQLRQVQKMDAIGQLTGGIAHDLNNLLTVVIGNLELLLARADDSTRRHAEPALQAAERGASLVHRLLAFSRRQPLAPDRLDLNALVRDVHELLRRALAEEVEIELVLAEGLWNVFADPRQVENALLNLVLNARDAMPEGGKLTIETRNARLDDGYAARNPDVEPGDYVMVAVTDTGCGMAPEVLARAFEPFFTTKEVGKGSGLGLSMIYGFAKQSRGHAKIYSESGHGTTVRLYLPRQGAEAGGHGPVEPAAPAGLRLPETAPTGERILVVEDDEAVRRFVVTVLERLGYRVTAAADAREALPLLAQDPEVDLLFTDVVIPGGISGRQLAESAQSLIPGLKVLYTSGYTENFVVHQGKLDTGVDFIAKPYHHDELAAKLRSILGRSQESERAGQEPDVEGAAQIGEMRQD